ncbi:MAG: cell wall-binding repeat-containing protein [Actinomycetaceae bacterium]|nr:cell wall-binding repeat-containing protein [Actinomycetaceae bacterium]
MRKYGRASRRVPLAATFAAVLFVTCGLAVPTPAKAAGTNPDTHAATVQLATPVRGTSMVGTRLSSCSGVYVAPGIILTAKHCVNGTDHATRAWDSGTMYNPVNLHQANAVREYPDASFDVALVYTSQTEHAWAPVVDTKLQAGTSVTLCGQNLVTTRGNFTSNGTNHCGSSSVAPAPWQSSRSVVRTEPPLIEQGDSGGPAYDPQGRVVGIISSEDIITQRVGNQYEQRIFNAIVPMSEIGVWLRVNGVPVISEGGSTGGAAGTPTAQPKPAPVVNLPAGMARVAGADRVATSIAAFGASGGAGSPSSVIVATGLNAADGLSATQLSGATGGAPVLLSMGRTDVDASVFNLLLNTAGVRQVYQVGGTAKFSQLQLAALAAKGIGVEVLAGADRFATAVVVATKTQALYQAQGRAISRVFLADGLNFPDALAAGAAAGRTTGLLLLTAGATLPAPTLAALSGFAVASAPVAVGGPAVLAAQSAGLRVEALAGTDRYDTALRLAGSLGGGGGLVAVSGRDFPDAISGGSLAVARGATLVLTPPDAGYVQVLQSLRQVTGGAVTVVGGEAALPNQQLATAFGSV